MRDNTRAQFDHGFCQQPFRVTGRYAARSYQTRSVPHCICTASGFRLICATKIHIPANQISIEHRRPLAKLGLGSKLTTSVCGRYRDHSTIGRRWRRTKSKRQLGLFSRDIGNWMVFSAGRSTTDVWVMDRSGRLSVSHRASRPETKQWRYLTIHPNVLGPRKLTRR